jgi:hypothetical protein
MAIEVREYLELPGNQPQAEIGLNGVNA